jgi:hypothetical protein
VTRLLRHLQRRALVVLTWLVLALSVPPAAEAESGRAHAVLALAARGSGAAALRTAPVAPPSEVARTARGVVESAAIARGALRGGGVALVAPAPHSPRPRDGRRLYLENARFLC